MGDGRMEQEINRQTGESFAGSQTLLLQMGKVKKELSEKAKLK